MPMSGYSEHANVWIQPQYSMCLIRSWYIKSVTGTNGFACLDLFPDKICKKFVFPDSANTHGSLKLRPGYIPHVQGVLFNKSG